MSDKVEATKLAGIIMGLMLSENLGDVHDVINRLHDLVGVARPNGNFDEGWEESDFERVEGLEEQQ